jgi:glycosyltransferase involved in cell wall biosynthesis
MSLPFVSVCTPTFNRRPFISTIIKCFENQNYPQHLLEWIIVDDGFDKIEDLVSHLPFVKYYKYDTKMTLGKKRNLCHRFSKGEIIVYMDDDDFYPPDRISHAVDTLLKNPKALCAGSSEMYFYFKDLNEMYKFGPYGKNHATAATFAFKKELLKQTDFNENDCVSEEKYFLKNYTIPFVQLNPLKTILVFSHIHNSYNKKELLKTSQKEFCQKSNLKVEDFVKNKDIFIFFTKDIDFLLEKYDAGKPEHKPDFLKHMEELKLKREHLLKQNAEDLKKQEDYNKLMETKNTKSIEKYEKKISDLLLIIQELTEENKKLKELLQQNNF